MSTSPLPFLVIATYITLYRRYRVNEGETNVLNLSQLKRTGNKVLLKGGALEDAIAAAITAMNEPKTCSTTILRRYLLDANKDRKQYQLGEKRLRCSDGNIGKLLLLY